jgi:hypothetical protein
MAELSRRLGEQAARQPAFDRTTSAEARRAALQDYDRARLRWIAMMAAGVLAAIATGVGMASLLPDEPEPPLPVATASAAPATAPSEARPLVAEVAEPQVTAPPVAVVPEPPNQTQAAAIEPAPDVNALRVDEVKELQAKLRAFGFNPGPIDGVAGPNTQSAAARYRQARGQPQTNAVDRPLLEQLRQDPAPPVAQRPVAQYAPRPDTRPTTAPAPRRSADPFEPLRAAGDRIGRWFESMLR